jgi:TIR domain
MMGGVFISYSRADNTFVARLYEALVEAEKDVWLDAMKIRPQGDWRSELKRGIEGAGAFAFVISPDSLASEVCAFELQHAVVHRKRIVPLLRRSPEARGIPDELVREQWVLARECDDFPAVFTRLISEI